MKSVELLPLFPLEAVLFPDSSLPLHIFEERYKLLVNECVREESEFGINCIAQSRIAAVGCSARVTNIVRRFDDGCMDVIIRGRRRFVLDRYEPARARYLVGYVRFFDHTDESMDADLARETILLYNAVVDLAYKSPTYRVSVEKIPERVSFVLAQKSGLQLPQRQHLLELSSENERLTMLHRHLHELLPNLKEAEDIQRVIRCDGYLESTKEDR